ncbi:MAG TPA: YncE family protein [Gemmatimonadales bacterium]|nr:YncE family protein [Gemmatimonadales bacterium]
MRTGLLLLTLVVPLACGGEPHPAARNPQPPAQASPDTGAAAKPPAHPPLPGMPPPLDSLNVYRGAGADMLDSLARAALPRVYVPLGGAASVTVIDPKTYTVLRTFQTATLPQHVVPSYDRRTLWVANDIGNSLTPIDPFTGKEGKSIAVMDPYNLYFTPDGQYAIVVAERIQRLDFRDPHTMALHDSVPVTCPGVDHMDFTADGRTAVATCEFSGKLLKLDVATHRIERYTELNPGKPSMPQDIRLAPDGSVFFVADMKADGVWVVDPDSLRVLGFIPTGTGAHGIYPSRDGKLFYVSNRGWHVLKAGPHGPGSVSVLDPRTRSVVATWKIPGGGSPDMGNVSVDGKELWLSGRYDHEVYVFDTATGQLIHRITVGRDPHGMTVWPQPGRYSLGHTGNMR